MARRELIFAVYLFILCFSVLCMGMIMLLLMKKTAGNRPLFTSAGSFSACVFLLILLYLIFYYQDTVQKATQYTLPYRLTDYVLWSLLPITWLRLWRQLLGDTFGTRQLRFFAAGEILSLCELAVSLIMSVFFQSPDYHVANKTISNVWISTELLYVVCLVGVFAVICWFTLRSDAQPLRKGYGIFCMAVLTWSFLSQLLLDIGMQTGRYVLFGWNYTQGLYSFVLSMLLLNLSTLFFLFKADFYHMFLAEPAVPPSVPEQPLLSDEEKIELLARQYNLTEREREIVALLRKGYSNPEIGDSLYVTRNTVKKHIQNIYGKLGVNSRKAVENLIDMQNHPPG